MLISELSIKGFKSYGNNEQTLKLNITKGELILLVGQNGAGKCVEKSTEINIDINKMSFTEESINFFEETDTGKKIILYIMKYNINLYEEYIKFKNSRK